METSRWWWFHSHHNGSNRSPWLQSTLSELDKKTKAMLNLIEEDADSFAQRAEMYCKKRPELISLVEDLYQAHRSLADWYDQAKSGHGTRLITTLRSPFSSMKYISEKTTNVTDKTYDSCSDTFDSEYYAESEVDDLKHEYEYDTDIVIKEVASEACDDEVMKLREEVERLKEDNEIQKAQLMRKDEEKREVIRQLGLAINLLKDENMELKKRFIKESPRKWNPREFSKLRGGLNGLLFNGSLKSHVNVVTA